MQVSKNIWCGEPIADFREVGKLARDGKCVVLKLGAYYKVIPAAFVLNMTLSTVLKFELFYAIKITVYDAA